MTSASIPRLALVGSAIWAVWAATVRPSWTATLLLLSPLVLVPIGLGLADRPDAGPHTPNLARTRPTVVAAASLAALSFTVDAGTTSALLTLPWFAMSVLVAGVGVRRFLARTALEPMLGVDAGLGFLAVGAGWLTISRLGANPLGFSDAIVELTAVHFHYAGFALPMVAGLTARGRRPALIPSWVTLGVPATALGILVGGTTEWIAATVMATGGLATAAQIARVASGERGRARVLLSIAALSLATGMVLALGWAWSVRFDWSYLGLDGMARWHGSLNAIGFGGAGLIGLSWTTPHRATTRHLGLHLRRPAPDVCAAIARSAESAAPTSPTGLLDGDPPDGYRRDEWRAVLPAGFDAGAAGLRAWAGHREAGIELDGTPEVADGSTVVMAIPIGTLWVTAATRIVEVVDGPDRSGFTYVTLAHHPEDGIERFEVRRRPDGSAEVVITAVWRPRWIGARLAPAVTRHLQRRTVARYLRGIAESAAAERSLPT